MFINTQLGNNLRKSFSVFTEPILPFKRKLSEDETQKMYRHFADHSWSHVDATGKIILGGGEDSAGMYYINENDLTHLY